MLKKRILQLLSISYFVIFTLLTYADGQKNTRPMVEKIFNAYDFDNIIADGYFKLELSEQTEAKPAYITTSSYPDSPINLTIHNRTLYIMSAYTYVPDMPQPQISIKLKELKELIVYGPTEVASKYFPTTGLKLVAQGYGKISIGKVGKLNIIEQKGNNTINISGIETETLDVNTSGFGKTTLSGKAESLYARLNEAAILKARNLAADKVIVQTHGNAQAYVHPLESLRAFAHEASTIYYYKQINELTSQPVQSGNVLEMGW